MANTVELRAKASLDGSGFQAGIVRMKSGVKGLSDSLNNTLKSRVAGVFGTAAITLAVKKTIEYGSAINDTSKRLNVSAEKLQEFTYAAKQNSAEMSDVTTALEKMGVAREDALAGNEELISSFERLGISVDDLKNKRADELLNIIGKTVKSGDAQQLIKPLRDVAGRSAGNLVAAFQSGLDEMAAEARAKGLVLKEEVVSALDNVGDKFTELKFVMMGELAPAIIWLVERFYDLIDVVKLAGAYLGGFVSKLNLKQLLNPKGGLTGLKGSIGDLTDRSGLGAFNPMKILFANAGKTGAEKGFFNITDEIKRQWQEFRSAKGLKGFLDERSVIGTLSSQLGEATSLGDIEIKKATDEIAKARAERAKRKADSRNNFTAPEFEGKEKDKAAKVKSFKPDSDSLVSIGNFLGSGRNLISQIQQKQLDVQKEILRVQTQMLTYIASGGNPISAVIGGLPL